MNLISHTQAEDQGITVTYCKRKGNKVYEFRKNNHKLLEINRDKNGLFTFEAMNTFIPVMARCDALRKYKCSQSQVNHTRAEGHADIQRCHERLGRLDPKYVKIMADRKLVDGLSLSTKQFEDCEACHIGNDRQPRCLKNSERDITKKNQVIFVDLLFPKYSSSPKAYKSVLIVVDGYSRFTTVYPLYSNTASEVNEAIKRYVT